MLLGPCRGAGTDANVSIELHGDKGFVGATRLDNNTNNFERGRKDEFEVGAGLEWIMRWLSRNAAITGAVGCCQERGPCTCREGQDVGFMHILMVCIRS
jgi:hypothetical protein